MDEDRYRRIEGALFADAGIAPTEHWVDLRRVGGRARVLDVGSGDPVLFLTGGPIAAATWAYVAAAVAGAGRRCVLLDRPGTGLSPARPSPVGPAELPSYVADLSVDVLDGLGVERADVVGSSLGGYSALRSAITHPARVSAVVLAGFPAFAPGWHQPSFFTALRLPVLGRVLLAMPATRGAARLSLRLLGHGRSLEQGRIPDAMLDWTVAWQRDTDTMRNDAAMIRACGTWRRGFDPRLDLTDADLARVAAPCLIVAGTDDPVGDDVLARDLAARMGDARVAVLDGAGHLPWLDDPAATAASIVRFLADAADRRGAGARQRLPSV